MKIKCKCGNLISDGADSLPSMAHGFPNQEYFILQDAIDEAIERSGDLPAEKEKACMAIHTLLGRLRRSAYECYACGRLWIYDSSNQFQTYSPDPDEPSKSCGIFRARQTPSPGKSTG